MDQITFYATGCCSATAQLRMQPQTRGRGATMNRRVDQGNAVVPAIIVVLVVLVVAIVVVSGGLNYYTRQRDHVVPVPADACPCNSEKDRQDMEQRLAEAEAGANQRNQEIASNAAGSKPFSGAEKEAGLPQLQEAMGGGEVNKVAGTEETCITWTSKDKPACVRWALQTHENVHAAACDKFIGKGGKGDWKKQGTAADYWREDAKAYQAEVDFLNSKLAKCPRTAVTYPGRESREEQAQRINGSKRRVAKSVGLPT
jgi:hypothetical protein